ncbi:hypothetical protein [Cyclobacterium qasimii]|uniref:Uncharacterized protein n=1 Tax=Cyclobacterium qasimii M12-11B TaxID=641524 RepID=S7VHP9_9BACT|nr:hypothetical protein [Cyclobacterium qasimii]EPR69531.1 hypothetical protein ADICYQ_1316 [Cyclobacterium qasimii M12-11B]
MFNFSDQVHVERFPDGFMLAHFIGGKDESTLLVIDGELLEKELYELVPHMSPGIIEQVKLIKHAKFFKKQCLTVFPETHPLEAHIWGISFLYIQKVELDYSDQKNLHLEHLILLCLSYRELRSFILQNMKAQMPREIKSLIYGRLFTGIQTLMLMMRVSLPSTFLMGM